MSHLTPREIVQELDKYIIGQGDAKRMVAIAMRNRWRRQHLDKELKDEVSPKNIIMIGPTGVGKTEIARRLAKLSGAPFIKVEATKYTEVGYVGRDVESMIRDLMEIGVNLVKKEAAEAVKERAELLAEERLLDLLLPPKPKVNYIQPNNDSNVDFVAYGDGRPPLPTTQLSDEQNTNTTASSESNSTREKLRSLWKAGKLNDREVEMEVETATVGIEILSVPGLEQVGDQMKDLFGKAFPAKRQTKRFKIGTAYENLIQQESEKLIEHDKVIETAKERVEQGGIIFLDEIDKIAVANSANRGSDVSREGVQRDLLPIVEGSTVNTKYGMIKTDHILFIAAGAFHYAKPADLIPELQGRFPLRVELEALGKDEFLRILQEPENSLVKQYSALLKTENVELDFSSDALVEISAFAEETNKNTENIGARRLYTIMEHILSDLSFEAPDKNGEKITIDSNYVKEHLTDVREDKDLSRYIL
ncbi:ATP-dependent protease ATPase subunit HslU [Desulfovibrio litoralis]|uniref:ATP-dependent protease ATPase subunit HslU n=1 Tax=Desulfovibrio litoralis DSM 11393 TaxID=1121455 RepID=A0A1M7SQB4_9BACT|nr:ATP-dependent protease ATPase subunit HslU [Desulfovibrio litoralis]SHN60604.1 ATP-dependent HslUV protease ATP-binding subunit HslU [Desulfovibrio litoralis DSM 11393]